tara:strand:+ start:5278 stop:6498 length:1221 start_codon:yes stop_codon:yes gene_type:complete
MGVRRGRSGLRAVTTCAILVVFVALSLVPHPTHAQLASEDAAVEDVDATANPTTPDPMAGPNTTDTGTGTDTGSGSDSDDTFSTDGAPLIIPGYNDNTGNDGDEESDRPTIDLLKLGLETLFPDSAYVGDGVSVRTGSTFADLEEDLVAIAAGMGNLGTGNGTDGGGNNTGGNNNTGTDTGDGETNDDASTDDTTTPINTDPRSFLYDIEDDTELIDPRLACKRGCIDSQADVTLVWCLDAVKYKYCNRLLTNDKPTVSVLDMEEGAIAAYMALAQRVPTPNAPECRPMLRKWMCYEFFTRCNTDETAFFPVCRTTCEATKYACGSPNWLECDQEVEELDGNAPDSWYVNSNREGKYIRGVKPGGEQGSPVFESDVLRCTGGGRGMFGGHTVWSVLLINLGVLVWS